MNHFCVRARDFFVRENHFFGRRNHIPVDTITYVEGSDQIREEFLDFQDHLLNDDEDDG